MPLEVKLIGRIRASLERIIEVTRVHTVERVTQLTPLITAGNRMRAALEEDTVGVAREATLALVRAGTDRLPADPAREGGNIATINTKLPTLSVTGTGDLRVAARGGGFEFAEARIGVAGAAESATIAFTSPVRQVRIVALDFNLLFRPSRDGITFQDQIFIFSGQPLPLDLLVHSFRVQRVGANDSNYRIEGYR